VFASDPHNIYRRIAAFRPDMGCTLLPPHWEPVRSTSITTRRSIIRPGPR
jgi:hypothetical protein